MFLKRKQIDERLDKLIWEAKREANLPGPGLSEAEFHYKRGREKGMVLGLQMARRAVAILPACEGPRRVTRKEKGDVPETERS
jgi:hypothetical protein